jgi:acyl-CoA thioester hydrolase
MPVDHPLLKGYPVVYRTQVAWGEMDALQHVNNVAYFRYFESARVAYFEQIGWPDSERRTGVGFILASASARFRNALTFPDSIQVGARVIDVGADRFTMEYRLVSETKNVVAAEGQGVVVTYRYGEYRKTPIPDEVRQRIAELERHGERGAFTP